MVQWGQVHLPDLVYESQHRYFLPPNALAISPSSPLGVAAFLAEERPAAEGIGRQRVAGLRLSFLAVGRSSASVNALITAVRTSLSLKVRAAWLAVLFVVIHLCVGVYLARTPAGWLTVIGSCVSTVAIFQMRGLANPSDDALQHRLLAGEQHH